MTLSLIVAMGENRVIGKDNRLPWRLPEDLRRFKSLTMGHPIVMGRKTFQSIGRVLPGRENIVLTRDPDFRAEGVTVVRDAEEVLARARREDVFVIGGAEIYARFLPHADALELTLVEGNFDGDAFFPDVDLRGTFPVVETSEPVRSEAGPRYRFVTARREP